MGVYYQKGLYGQLEGDSRYFYRRYMDDIIILANTRWHRRVAAKTVAKHALHDRRFYAQLSKKSHLIRDGFNLRFVCKTLAAMGQGGHRDFRCLARFLGTAR
jgi:hypothetical protein